MKIPFVRRKALSGVAEKRRRNDLNGKGKDRDIVPDIMTTAPRLGCVDAVPVGMPKATYGKVQRYERHRLI